MIDQKTGEIKDNSVIIAELRVELNRLGLGIKSDRVRAWCKRAGYENIHQLDTEGLLALLDVVRQVER